MNTEASAQASGVTQYSQHPGIQCDCYRSLRDLDSVDAAIIHKNTYHGPFDVFSKKICTYAGTSKPF